MQRGCIYIKVRTINHNDMNSNQFSLTVQWEYLNFGFWKLFLNQE